MLALQEKSRERVRQRILTLLLNPARKGRGCHRTAQYPQPLRAGFTCKGCHIRMFGESARVPDSERNNGLRSPYTSVMTQPEVVMTPDGLLALSIKQPWAALIIAGVKTVEVRTWPTSFRGPVLIHTGRSADVRPEGWQHITTPELQALAKLSGGILGLAHVVACRTYESAAEFAADALLHRNAPTWFAPPRLFGFEFANPRPLPFRSQSGKLFFFPVDGVVVSPPEQTGSGPG